LAKGALDGQIALITGAAKRIGRVIALGLAEEGVEVIVHYNSSESEAEELVALLRRRGRQAWKLQGALDNGTRIEDLWLRAKEAVSQAPISILVNNASIFPTDSLADFDAEELRKNLDINALAPLELIRLFAAQGKKGSVVNLLDSRIGGYMRHHVSYSLSKRMLFSLTRMLAVELAPLIRINAVAPGMIVPPEGQSREELERLAARAPLNRWGQPGDVARAVVFLLENEFLTGQVLYVDGGAFLREDLYG
jgi:pteridine reductase